MDREKMEIKIFNLIKTRGDCVAIYIYIYSPTKFRLNYMDVLNRYV